MIKLKRKGLNVEFDFVSDNNFDALDFIDYNPLFLGFVFKKGYLFGRFEIINEKYIYEQIVGEFIFEND